MSDIKKIKKNIKHHEVKLIQLQNTQIQLLVLLKKIKEDALQKYKNRDKQIKYHLIEKEKKLQEITAKIKRINSNSISTTAKRQYIKIQKHFFYDTIQIEKLKMEIKLLKIENNLQKNIVHKMVDKLNRKRIIITKYAHNRSQNGKLNNPESEESENNSEEDDGDVSKEESSNTNVVERVAESENDSQEDDGDVSEEECSNTNVVERVAESENDSQEDDGDVSEEECSNTNVFERVAESENDSQEDGRDVSEEECSNTNVVERVAESENNCQEDDRDVSEEAEEECSNINVVERDDYGIDIDDEWSRLEAMLEEIHKET